MPRIRPAGARFALPRAPGVETSSSAGPPPWSVVGLHLLDKNAAAAAEVLDRGLRDDAHEVRMMAAWTLIKLGKSERAMACLDELLFQGTSNQAMLHNVLDWMGEPAFPLVIKYVTKGGNKKGRYGTGILARIAQLNGLTQP